MHPAFEQITGGVVMLVDDDPEISQLKKAYFFQKGCLVFHFRTLTHAWLSAREVLPDAVVIELLPAGISHSLLQGIVQQVPSVQLIISRGEVVYKKKDE